MFKTLLQHIAFVSFLLVRCCASPAPVSPGVTPSWDTWPLQDILPSPGNLSTEQAAPYWQASALVDGNVRNVSLDDFAGNYLVLFFYPLDYMFVCPSEVLALNEQRAQFEKIGVEVVGVSKDSHFSHRAWLHSLAKERNLFMRIPLVSDLTQEITKKYGVHTVGRENGLRAVFIVDPKGVLREVKLPVGRLVEHILGMVKAAQDEDENEPCEVAYRVIESTLVTFSQKG